MPDKLLVVFVCEHGAAKSVLAATYFDELARKTGLSLRAVARGMHPDPQLSPQVIQGLIQDGLKPKETFPKKLTGADLEAAFRVVSFCELPIEYLKKAIIERWDGVPAASENYEQARDVIRSRIRTLLTELKAAKQS